MTLLAVLARHHRRATLTLSGTFANATVGVAYSSDLTIAGGDGAYSNPRVTVGALPGWATLSVVGAMLRLSGTPSGGATTISMTVAVDSGDGQTATSAQSFAVTIATYTTLNPSDKSSNIALSGGNLVATGLTDSSGMARSVKELTGKRYFEAAFSYTGYAALSIAAGVARATSPLSTVPGATADDWGFIGPGGGLYHAGTRVLDVGLSPGNVIGFAVDVPAGKLWVRDVLGTWMSGDPATGSAPSFTGLTGPLFAAAAPWYATTSSVVTMHFDPATFAFAAPAGFDPVIA